MENIKLIWDFRGHDATQIAIHHQKHLAEYAIKNQLSPSAAGSETVNEVYAIAFIIVPRKDMIAFRDALRPHRGELL